MKRKILMMVFGFVLMTILATAYTIKEITVSEEIGGIIEENALIAEKTEGEYLSEYIESRMSEEKASELKRKFGDSVSNCLESEGCMKYIIPLIEDYLN